MLRSPLCAAGERPTVLVRSPLLRASRPLAMAASPHPPPVPLAPVLWAACVRGRGVRASTPFGEHTPSGHPLQHALHSPSQRADSGSSPHTGGSGVRRAAPSPATSEGCGPAQLLQGRGERWTHGRRQRPCTAWGFRASGQGTAPALSPPRPVPTPACPHLVPTRPCPNPSLSPTPTQAPVPPRSPPAARLWRLRGRALPSCPPARWPRVLTGCPASRGASSVPLAVPCAIPHSCPPQRRAPCLLMAAIQQGVGVLGGVPRRQADPPHSVSNGTENNGAPRP